jgi:hypothetical protein
MKVLQHIFMFLFILFFFLLPTLPILYNNNSLGYHETLLNNNPLDFVLFFIPRLLNDLYFYVAHRWILHNKSLTKYLLLKKLQHVHPIGHHGFPVANLFLLYLFICHCQYYLQ